MKIAGKTDVGMIRKTNQDTFRIAVLCDGIGFALVCDGMGGVKGGDQASAIAKRMITSVIRDNIQTGMMDDELHDLLLRAIFEANRQIYEQAQNQPEFAGMGTTALAAIITPDCAYIGHVGDSRLYQLHSGQFYQVTRDHSRVQEMTGRGAAASRPEHHHPGGRYRAGCGCRFAGPSAVTGRPATDVQRWTFGVMQRPGDGRCPFLSSD